MAKYRKKPVVIEAIQYDGHNLREIAKFVGTDLSMVDNDINLSLIPVIKTLEGDMLISKGDYVIKGVQGEFYPCKPDIFRQTYEEVPKLIVEKYERTCIAFPSQWDIWTVDGKYIYGRYRGGHFTMTLNAFEPNEELLYEEYTGDSFGGDMSDEEMMKKTKDILDWGPAEAL